MHEHEYMHTVLILKLGYTTLSKGQSGTFANDGYEKFTRIAYCHTLRMYENVCIRMWKVCTRLFFFLDHTLSLLISNIYLCNVKHILEYSDGCHCIMAVIVPAHSQMRSNVHFLFFDTRFYVCRAISWSSSMCGWVIIFIWRFFLPNLCDCVHSNEWLQFLAIWYVLWPRIFMRTQAVASSSVKFVEIVKCDKNPRWITNEIVFDRWERFIYFTIIFELLRCALSLWHF